MIIDSVFLINASALAGRTAPLYEMTCIHSTPLRAGLRA